MRKSIVVILTVSVTLVFASVAMATCDLQYDHDPVVPVHPTDPIHPTDPVHPTTPPADHNCTYSGAGKDGQPGNDDCAPVTTTVTTPTPPVTITVYVDRIVEKTVPGPERVVTITKIVKSKPKIKRIVVTRKVTKIVKIKVPGKCPPYTKFWHGKCVVPGKG